jgi:hypothetical protein
VVALDINLEVAESEQIQMGQMDRWAVHVAELIGIFYTINFVFRLTYQYVGNAFRRPMKASILSHGESALQSTQNARTYQDNGFFLQFFQEPHQFKRKMLAEEDRICGEAESVF